jgi:hypothetical protein
MRCDDAMSMTVCSSYCTDNEIYRHVRSLCLRVVVLSTTAKDMSMLTQAIFFDDATRRNVIKACRRTNFNNS